MGPTTIFTGKWPSANKSTLLVWRLNSGYVVAALATMGVDTPETAMLGMEGQAEWKQFQGLL